MRSEEAPRTQVLAAVVVTGLAALVYLNALNAPFVYDDHRTVVENDSIRELTDWRAIVLLQPLRPVLNFSYALDYAFWGVHPYGYHLTNVLLHILNALLLLRLGTIAAADRQVRDSQGVATAPGIVGVTAALMFAVHPLMTSAVTYVAGRSEVLCATFFLAAMLSARRGLTESAPRWWMLTALFWLLALGTKEVAVMFPFVLLGYERFVLTLNAEQRRRAFRWVGVLLGVASLAAAARVALFAQLEYRGDVSFESQFFFVVLNVIVQYLRLLVVPEGQAIFHAVPFSGPWHARTLLSVAVIVSLLVIAWRARTRAGLVTFGVAWFFLLLVPSSILVMLDRAEPMAEHRVYLASCGMFLVAATVVEWLLRPTTLKARPTRLTVHAVLAIALVSLAGRTLIRNAVWSNPVGLWREAVAKAPGHWFPRLLLGEALHAAGRREEAIVEYRRGIGLRPDQELAYQKLALAWLEIGRPDEAVKTFERLRERSPQSAVAANGLGGLALITGDRLTAREHFLQALTHDAGNVPARQSLALLAEMEPIDAQQALRLCEEIRQLAPRTPGNIDCINRNRARLAGAPVK